VAREGESAENNDGGAWLATSGPLKPFRFGINVPDAGSPAEWQDKARRTEALGYAWLATLPAVNSGGHVRRQRPIV
jgi:hypothetical protein